MKITKKEFERDIASIDEQFIDAQYAFENIMKDALKIQSDVEGHDGNFDELINDMVECIKTIEVEMDELSSFLSQVELTFDELQESGAFEELQESEGEV